MSGAGEGRPERADVRRNRDAVLDAARRLLSERPDASMRDIADASGLGRTTVYRHFATRDALVSAIFEVVLAESAAMIREATTDPPSPRAALEVLGRGMVAIGVRYRFLAAFPEAARTVLADVLEPDFEDPLTAWLREEQARGGVRTDVPASWLVAVVQGLSVSAVTEVISGRMGQDEAGAALGATFADAVAPRG